MAICNCEECSLWTYKHIDGSYRPGRDVDQQTVLGHAFAQKEKRKLEAEAVREAREELDEDHDPTQTEASNDTPPAPAATPRSTKLKSEGIRQRIRDLGVLESSITHKSRLVTVYTKLSFLTKPTSRTETPGPLDERRTGTMEFVSYRFWLTSQLESLRATAKIGDKDADRRLETLMNNLEKELARLVELLRIAWEREKIAVGLIRMNPDLFARPVNAPRPKLFSLHRSNLSPFLIAVLISVTIFHTIVSISRPYLQFFLSTMQVLVFGAFTVEVHPVAKAVLSKAQELMLKAIPRDPRAKINGFDLEPNIVLYATCATCFATYAPNSQSPDDPYPHVCSHSEAGRPICGTPLVYAAQRVEGGRTHIVYKAIKAFPYHSLKVYIVTMLAKLGMEELLETSFEELFSKDGRWRDIIDSPGIRAFRGRDGRTKFSVQLNGELHLVFTLFIDWFNPHLNKRAGKSHSIGGIYLACLNLPPHLRFRSENIYLAGIIPGPNEPSLTEVNHFLRPLVDELLEFWHAGVYVPSTLLRPDTGRLVRIAVIPLVCDLPAMRKTAGFAGHSARFFCSYCNLLKKDMDNVDRSTWPKGYTWAEHLDCAKEWRDAASDAARKKAFKKHGIRWSELLRLPYWDPTKFAVVDTMHNLFLGELRHHCMDVWGIPGIDDDKDTSRNSAFHTPEMQALQFDRVLVGLQKRSTTVLMRQRRDYLVAVAELNAVIEPKSKAIKQEITDALLAWVAPMADDDIDSDNIKIPEPLPYPTSCYSLPRPENEPEEEVEGPSKYLLFTGKVLAQVRRDIAEAVVPTWIEKPPSNFGEARHGKLKADQWRTLCTIFMVTTLVTLWGHIGASEEQKLVLENFVQLVVAADLATRRTMSPERVALYDKNIVAYVQGLRTIYDHSLVPNHHLALHLKDFLLLFGPVHGWWAYPYERLNGILQRMTTNYKPAEMPLTYMRKFYMSSTLRYLVTSLSWPDVPVITQWVKTFKSVFKDITKGTRFADTFSHLDAPAEFTYNEKKQEMLPRPIYDQLFRTITSANPDHRFASAHAARNTARLPRLPEEAQSVGSIMRGSVKFTTATTGKRDCSVLFACPGTTPGTTSRAAGQIEQIFYHHRKHKKHTVVEPFVVIKEWLPLCAEHLPHDPFRSFPELETTLYYDTFGPSRVVPLTDIIAHVATFTYTPEEIEKPCIIIKSLDRD